MLFGLVMVSIRHIRYVWGDRYQIRKHGVGGIYNRQRLLGLWVSGMGSKQDMVRLMGVCMVKYMSYKGM